MVEMEEIQICNPACSNLRDLAGLCVPVEELANPIFQRGKERKEIWSREMMKKGIPFVKLGYSRGELAGFIHFEPIPEEEAVNIQCIFVPQEKHQKKGVATRLLEAVIRDMRKPQTWNNNRPAKTLRTYAFSTGNPSFLSQEEFYRRRGFRQTGEDPLSLYLPLEEEYTHTPSARPPSYVFQQEDAGTVLILHGPSFCPWDYFFNLKAERSLCEIAPALPVRWIDRATEPEEIEKRGGYQGIVVNGQPILSFVLYREEFRREVEKALKADLQNMTD